MNALLREERSQIDPTELPVYDAQNTACFYFFTKATENADWDELLSGSEEDRASIVHAYTSFRDEIEQSMKEHAPKTYEAYLIAIAQGDADEARRIMSEVFEEEE